MSATTREQIADAFFALIAQASGFKASSRRFIHWDSVNETQMPFLTMLKTGEERSRQDEGLPIIALTYHVFVYTSAGQDPEDVPETAMNTLLDAIDAAVTPTGSDALVWGKQTLGGLVSHCYALGDVFVDAGDIDGKGVATVKFQILAPWY
jgi:hypothetical protein